MATPVLSNLDFGSAAKIVNLPAPSAGGDAANKTYVDGAVTGASPKRFQATIGDGVLTQIDVVHALNTKDLLVAVYIVSSGIVVQCDTTMFDVNTVRLNFAVAPATNTLRVVILG